MNNNQEKALFGNACGDGKTIASIEDITGIVLGGRVYGGPSIVESCDRLQTLARSQRDAIGALIEWRIIYADNFAFGKEDDRPTKIILSAVIQDTWEDVRKAWEKNQ